MDKEKRLKEVLADTGLFELDLISDLDGNEPVGHIKLMRNTTSSEVDREFHRLFTELGADFLYGVQIVNTEFKLIDD